MNWLMRRYNENNDYSYIIVFATCALISIILMTIGVILISEKQYLWSLLPLLGSTTGTILCYSLTSYSKPREKMKGHYNILDFYKIINPVKKINWIFEYLVAVFASNLMIHFFFFAYLLKNFESQIFTPLVLFIFFLTISIFFFWVKFSFIKKINEKPIESLDSIFFFKNFFEIDYAKAVHDDYIDYLSRMSEETISNGNAKNKLSKSTLMLKVSILKKELKIRERNKKSKDIEKILELKSNMEHYDEK